MSEETIDYLGLVDRLQHENEQLRLHILKMRQASRSTISGATVRDFLIKHYVVISASVLILFAAMSFIDTVRSFLPDNKSKE